MTHWFNRLLTHRAVYPLVLLLCCAPAGWLIGRGALNQLGANPAEALLRGTGLWTLRFLCLTLAVTPLRQWAGLTAVARWRRTLGLTCFTYATLHFLAYAWLDMGFDGPATVRDLAKRPFALVGFAAFALLLPLALTSFNRAIRWLGARRWQRLHRAVYAVAGLALLHFFWLRAGKHRFGEVAIYAAIVGLLLTARVISKPGRGSAHRKPKLT
jgi:sulfoxide reductase heme-binding subunit YedZ